MDLGHKMKNVSDILEKKEKFIPLIKRHILRWNEQQHKDNILPGNDHWTRINSISIDGWIQSKLELYN